MNWLISEIFGIATSLIVTVVLITISIAFTNQANKEKVVDIDIKVFYSELQELREWRKYEGQVTGADIADFIIRHKDTCDIVIQDSKLSLNSKISTYLTSGMLIMGFSNNKNIPDSFWEPIFIYDNIIGGRGDYKYTATLLYDGQLVPEYESSVQVRGGVVTGIIYVIN